MEDIQIEKSDSKGIDMNNVQVNRNDTKVFITKVNEEPTPRQERMRSPKPDRIPSVGIDLLENRSRRRGESSLDLSLSGIGSSENDLYDLPMEELGDIQDKIDRGRRDRPNLFEYIDRKESRDSKSRSRDRYPRESLRPNLGKETLNDMNFGSPERNHPSMDLSMEGYSLNDLDKKLGGEPDPYNISENPKESAEPEREKHYDDKRDDLDDMNIDDLLSECATLKEKHGINTPQHFNRRTPADEVRAFIRRERRKREKVNAEKMGGKILLTTITALEWLNTKFDPFDLKLDGWSENVHENIDDYNEVFGELYEKYKTSANVPPEIKLIMMIGGSAAMVHLTNTMFRPSPTIPQQPSPPQQPQGFNPEMMRQFAQAPPQSQQPRREMRGPEGVDDLVNELRQTPMMGPMRTPGPQMPQGTGLPPMPGQQLPRREMSGPKGVDDILNELKSQTPQQQQAKVVTLEQPNAKKTSKQASPNNSVISRGANNRRTINLNL